MCPTLPGGGAGGGWGGLSECVGGWVSNRPPPPPPRRVRHCGGTLGRLRRWSGGGGGLWDTHPATQLPWAKCLTTGKMPPGGGTFVGLWVCHKSVWGGSLKSPPAPPPPGKGRESLWLLEAPVRKSILQMHTPARSSQCWSGQTPAWTRSVHLDAPGQRHGQHPRLRDGRPPE